MIKKCSFNGKPVGNLIKELALCECTATRDDVKEHIDKVILKGS